MNYLLGIDVGSTTIKTIILDKNYNIVHKQYERHYSDITETLITCLKNVNGILKDQNVKIAITGSGAVDISEILSIHFVQEVSASTSAVEQFIPHTDVAIELGGEDAKITYFGDSLEQRMNGTCAGGTGAFIDQMAILLETDALGINDLAKNYSCIYPIASRCGVFAKTDIQPLLNEGAKQEDIAVSVLQAVVNQTISGLAQGRKIQGNIAFLGGPLSFLSELRQRFIETLKLKPEQVIFPDNSKYFVAIGAAINADDFDAINFNQLFSSLDNLKRKKISNKNTLPSLFESEEDYENFRNRHNKNKALKRSISDYKGDAFLGIDAGSTTTKIVLISDQSELLYSYYNNNKGNPLQSTINALIDLEQKMNNETTIRYATITGYGEHLIKAALKIDHGEIETVSHYKAANYFLPGVDFVIDIGGQDMKSLKIKNGIIDSIMLNEACSSGCGSFIETFAQSLNTNVKDFAKLAVESRNPVDLGTRCTVFMNSKVKQAQREGATVADISAGIAISVIKNALFKVIRINSTTSLGEKIVVQGGTFYNDAVLRAVEQITNREVVRPDIAGIMGAFGAALISKERYEEGYKSTLLKGDKLQSFSFNSTLKRCHKCNNKCLLTISQFSDKSYYVTGNRCEKGAEDYLQVSNNDLPNLYLYKSKRVFDYKPLGNNEHSRGKIGIPRVLNMYEDYPFWFTFLSELGYQVILSRKSNKELYELGMDSIASESVCYPAKLSHGHIEYLINLGLDKIFYPCVPYNIKEDKMSGNHFNCPIVTSYPETLKNNIDFKNVAFYKPFVNISNKKNTIQSLYEYFKKEGISKAEIRLAVDKSYNELANYKQDVKKEGQRALQYIEDHNKKGIVLAGRPYHVDLEINHGIPEMIESYGYVVLSEDSLPDDVTITRPINAIDQWAYHTRLYKAATFVSKKKNLELIQLNSFGCGLDAITSDQVKNILEKNNKIFTLIKIDEINSLGAVRIRVRSLMAVIEERERLGIYPKKIDNLDIKKTVFTKEMKKKHTLLVPQMSPIHFQFFEAAGEKAGYNLKVLPSIDKKAIDVGLRTVNNDACYPSIIVTGQMIHALESGKYDLDNTSLIISQTGGGCRATNYIAFIRKALKDSGFDNIPVISFNTYGLEKQPGFKLSYTFLRNLLISILFGDVLSRVLYRTRPYEVEQGSAYKLYEKWVEVLNNSFDNLTYKKVTELVNDIVDDFNNLDIYEDVEKPKVGIVGEILVKYHPTANNFVIDVLEAEGAEVVCPDFLDFVLYSIYNGIVNYDENIKGNIFSKQVYKMVQKWVERYQNIAINAFSKTDRFLNPVKITELADGAKKHLSLLNQTGEGWFLTAEMIELIEHGVNNVVCVQPFACLPNHITGKGMIRRLKNTYPYSNIVPIDYDPGSSEVNQINRIKLMMTTARRNMGKKNIA